MKFIKSIMFICFTLMATNLFAQQTKQINLADSTGLPGDHFSLEAALATFKESKSPEDFEKKINSKDNVVNNLDLDGNGKVDYVRVITDKKENTHIIIMQVQVSKKESQDVAVIEIEKQGDKSALLQIIGDEDLYGESKIVEPVADSEPADKGVNKKGPAAYSPGYVDVFVNVWGWPCVTYMYTPVYVVYVSPWHWDYWPGWWSPWHPHSWHYYHMHNYHHHHHYHHTPYHRAVYAHQVYAPRRTTSTQVNTRYRDAQLNYRANRPAPDTQGKKKSLSQPAQVRPQTKPGQIQAKPGIRNEQLQVKPQSKPGSLAPNPQTKPVRPQTQPQTKPDQLQPKPSQPEPRNTPNQQVKPQQQSRPETNQQMKPRSRPQHHNEQMTIPQSKPQSSPKGSGNRK